MYRSYFLFTRKTRFIHNIMYNYDEEKKKIKIYSKIKRIICIVFSDVFCSRLVSVDGYLVTSVERAMAYLRGRDMGVDPLPLERY